MGLLGVDLSEEEAYLYAIIMDHSGLDLAEFAWWDGSSDDGCFRAWPFQWTWWRDPHQLQVDQCARSVGKSLSIKARMFNFPFRRPGQEAVVTAPELNHLTPIVSLIEEQFYGCRLGKEMLKRRGGVTHKPFQMNFANGSRIIGRIPQRDGKGVKGIHPLQLELDEAQDYPERGWIELNATLKRGFEGAEWRAHGVTRGIRDKFHEFTKGDPADEHLMHRMGGPDMDWRIHRMTAMHRPNWTAQERREEIAKYGGHRDDPDYRRNILGLHGDATAPLFVVTRLYRCIEDDLSSEFNTEEYCHLEITNLHVEDLGDDGDLRDLLVLPEMHRNRVTWAGMDVGWTHDPTEILIWEEYHPDANERRSLKARKKACPKDGISKFKLLSRITLKRLGNLDQVRLMLGLIDFYGLKAFGMDKTGAGEPLFSTIQTLFRTEEDVDSLAQLGFSPRAARKAAELIKGYGFGSKVTVDIDETIEIDEYDGDPVRDAAIKRNVLEHSTDKLREYVDEGRLWLPWEKDLISEFEGQTFSYGRSNIDQFGKRRRIFSEGKFHALDAARMFVMAHSQGRIEAIVNAGESNDPVFPSFFGN